MFTYHSVAVCSNGHVAKILAKEDMELDRNICLITGNSTTKRFCELVFNRIGYLKESTLMTDDV